MLLLLPLKLFVLLRLLPMTTMSITTTVKRSSPNYFLGFKLVTDEFQARASLIQNSLLQVQPNLKNCMTSTRKLHFTLFVMTLSSKEEIENARSCLLSAKEHIVELIRAKKESIQIETKNDRATLVDSSTVSSKMDIAWDPNCSPVVVSFGKLSGFGKKVLYADPHDTPTLDLLKEIKVYVEQKFTNPEWKLSHTLQPKKRIPDRPCPSSSVVANMIINDGIGESSVEKIAELEPNGISNTEDNDDWVAHATIGKTSADRKNGKRLSFYRGDYEPLSSILEGLEVPVASLDLLSMQEMDDMGYYNSYATINFTDV